MKKEVWVKKNGFLLHVCGGSEHSLKSLETFAEHCTIKISPGVGSTPELDIIFPPHLTLK